MKGNTTKRIEGFVASLIEQGGQVLNQANYGTVPTVRHDLFAKWAARCKLLDNMLGQLASPWHAILVQNSNHLAGRRACHLNLLSA